MGRGEEKRREGKGKGEWDAGPAGRQVPGAPGWQKTGLAWRKKLCMDLHDFCYQR